MGRFPKNQIQDNSQNIAGWLGPTRGKQLAEFEGRVVHFVDQSTGAKLVQNCPFGHEVKVQVDFVRFLKSIRKSHFKHLCRVVRVPLNGQVKPVPASV